MNENTFAFFVISGETIDITNSDDGIFQGLKHITHKDQSDSSARTGNSGEPMDFTTAIEPISGTYSYSAKSTGTPQSLIYLT